MLMPTDIEILRRFQEKYLLKTLGGDGDPLADHQSASNAIDRLIQQVEQQKLLLDNRTAKCWLYEDEKTKEPVFSITVPPYEVKWRRGGMALPLFVQKIADEPIAWMYLEDGEERFTLDPVLKDQKTYKSIPAVPLYQSRIHG